jgi:hypothetical protein
VGLFDKIKDVTGIALSGPEQYKRAYEKGVFLQPPDYVKAAEHFATAQDKFNKEGNLAMAQRAAANSILYRFKKSPSASLLPELLAALQPLPEIEQLGSDKELVPTGSWISEIEALLAELSAEQQKSAAGFGEASRLFQKMGSIPLHFAPMLNRHGPVDNAMDRCFYCLASSNVLEANRVMLESPERASDLLQKSLVAFNQGKTKDRADEVQITLNRARMKRHCWMCDREVQGAETYYFNYPADVTPYHGALVQSLQQDVGLVDVEKGTVVLCSVCGTAVERQADRYAVRRMNELKSELWPVLQRMQGEINEQQAQIKRLVDAVKDLSRHSHHH